MPQRLFGAVSRRACRQKTRPWRIVVKLHGSRLRAFLSGREEQGLRNPHTARLRPNKLAGPTGRGTEPAWISWGAGACSRQRQHHGYAATRVCLLALKRAAQLLNKKAHEIGAQSLRYIIGAADPVVRDLKAELGR